MSLVRDTSKSLALSRELETLLDKDAIEPIDWHTRLNGFYSFGFDSGEGWWVPHVPGLAGAEQVFRMLRMADVLQSVPQGAWFVSIDLKDAYFHVPIAPHHRQFLRFAFQGQAYQFKVMPFGLSLDPLHIYEVCGSGPCSHTSQRLNDLAISGRLANCFPNCRHCLAPWTCDPVGHHSQLLQEQSYTQSEGRLPWQDSRLIVDESLPFSEKSGEYFATHRLLPDRQC